MQKIYKLLIPLKGCVGFSAIDERVFIKKKPPFGSFRFIGRHPEVLSEGSYRGTDGCLKILRCAQNDSQRSYRFVGADGAVGGDEIYVGESVGEELFERLDDDVLGGEVSGVERRYAVPDGIQIVMVL